MKQNVLFKINPTIFKSILVELSKIEKEKKIDILFAIESGSRAWGFPSIDSDYDVRFIYKRKLRDYLSVRQLQETLTFPINDNLDIAGWDIKKVLRHVLKSNAVMFEWQQSPIIYSQFNNFKSKLWNLSKQYFSPHAALSHYLGICKKYSSELSSNEQIKIKRIFYVLRPLLAALWICDNKFIPHIIFQELIKNSSISDSIKTIISDLLEKKFESNEKKLITVPTELVLYIQKTYSTCEERKKLFIKEKFATDKIDDFFYQLITG